MQRLPLFLLIILVGLQWPLWTGYYESWQIQKKIDQQKTINQELIYRNAALQADVQDLKQGSDAVQERARLQLGMVKSDEVFVQVMDQPSEIAPAVTPAAVPSTTATAPVGATPPSTTKPVTVTSEKTPSAVTPIEVKH